MFDAGSRHTSAYVYKWPGNMRLRGTAVPVDEIFHVSNNTGISSFASNPKGAGWLVGKLMKSVTREVPDDKRSSTPVYLGATAGMRLERYVFESFSISPAWLGPDPSVQSLDGHVTVLVLANMHCLPKHLPMCFFFR